MDLSLEVTVGRQPLGFSDGPVLNTSSRPNLTYPREETKEDILGESDCSCGSHTGSLPGVSTVGFTPLPPTDRVYSDEQGGDEHFHHLSS